MMQIIAHGTKPSTRRLNHAMRKHDLRYMPATGVNLFRLATIASFLFINLQLDYKQINATLSPFSYISRAINRHKTTPAPSSTLAGQPHRKTARVASFSMTCPSDISIHPCGCMLVEKETSIFGEYDDDIYNPVLIPESLVMTTTIATPLATDINNDKPTTVSKVPIVEVPITTTTTTIKPPQSHSSNKVSDTTFETTPLPPTTTKAHVTELLSTSMPSSTTISTLTDHSTTTLQNKIQDVIKSTNTSTTISSSSPKATIETNELTTTTTPLPTAARLSSSTIKDYELSKPTTGDVGSNNPIEYLSNNSIPRGHSSNITIHFSTTTKEPLEPKVSSETVTLSTIHQSSTPSTNESTSRAQKLDSIELSATTPIPIISDSKDYNKSITFNDSSTTATRISPNKTEISIDSSIKPNMVKSNDMSTNIIPEKVDIKTTTDNKVITQIVSNNSRIVSNFESESKVTKTEANITSHIELNSEPTTAKPISSENTTNKLAPNKFNDDQHLTVALNHMSDELIKLNVQSQGESATNNNITDSPLHTSSLKQALPEIEISSTTITPTSALSSTTTASSSTTTASSSTIITSSSTTMASNSTTIATSSTTIAPSSTTTVSSSTSTAFSSTTLPPISTTISHTTVTIDSTTMAKSTETSNLNLIQEITTSKPNTTSQISQLDTTTKPPDSTRTTLPQDQSTSKSSSTAAPSFTTTTASSTTMKPSTHTRSIRTTEDSYASRLSSYHASTTKPNNNRIVLTPVRGRGTVQPVIVSNMDSFTNVQSMDRASRITPRRRRFTRYLNDNSFSDIPEFESKYEVIACCRNIQNAQVLRDAIRGFRGHKINSFVIDSCKIPPFPNDLFNNIDVRWIEMINSTVQFHNNFLQSQG